MKDDPSGFVSLSFELYLKIFAELDGRDLIRLGKTCTTLREVTQQRRVWEDALRLTCRRHELFEPSYSIDTMGLKELQLAALGPWVWHNKIHKAGRMGRVLNPLGNKQFQWCTPRSRWDSVPIDAAELLLIPGGRYLVTISTGMGVEEARRFISLWDLGGSMETPLSIVETSSQGRCSLHGPELVSRSLRFVVQIIREGTRVLQVYEVGPLPEVANLRLLDELSLVPGEAGDTICTLSSRNCIQNGKIFFRLTYRDGNRRQPFFVWDFKSSHLVSWLWEPSEVMILETTFTQSHVIAFTKDSVVAWEVPSVEHWASSKLTMKKGKHTGKHTVDLRPRFRIDYSDKRPGYSNSESIQIFLTHQWGEKGPCSPIIVALAITEVHPVTSGPGITSDYMLCRLDIKDNFAGASLSSISNTHHKRQHISDTPNILQNATMGFTAPFSTTLTGHFGSKLFSCAMESTGEIEWCSAAASATEDVRVALLSNVSQGRMVSGCYWALHDGGDPNPYVEEEEESDDEEGGAGCFHILDLS
ncbi:hypothetical protein D9611_002676 [Ephemerocybe angulata]|uniref:F-box domain-containing protein n=1 Tax=Ephemerocybe angulata TaxID=980116 RepID=A0A8H5FEC2_9AGAR|nr:hypothetical protein D9611_002676 [Tulosesus angulatus]